MPLESPLLDVLTARARQEASFVVQLASTCTTKWDDALAAYPELFREAAKALLDRAAASRERRSSRG